MVPRLRKTPSPTPNADEERSSGSEGEGAGDSDDSGGGDDDDDDDDDIHRGGLSSLFVGKSQTPAGAAADRHFILLAYVTVTASPYLCHILRAPGGYL